MTEFTCTHCGGVNVLYTPEQIRARKITRAHELRMQYLAQGRCVDCGEPLDTTGVRCEACRIKKNRRQNDARSKRAARHTLGETPARGSH